MAIITNKAGEPSLKETLIALLLDVNAALWHVRKDQNTGDGSSPGIQVLLPEAIDIEVVFGADGAINSVTRTQSSTGSGGSSTTRTTTQPEKVSTAVSSSTKDTPDVTDTVTDSRENTGVTTTATESGGDTTIVDREYN